jgi:hypothetical protein
MATTYKVLGQSNPSATTLTDAYTVPAVTQAVISSIVIANRSATPTNYRISVAINGAANADSQYIAYGVVIGPNETQTLTLGISLGDTDVIRVYATLATLTFSIFGAELT